MKYIQANCMFFQKAGESFNKVAGIDSDILAIQDQQYNQQDNY
jgi:hypothetical protein